MKQVKVEWCENFIRAQFTKHHAFPGGYEGRKGQTMKKNILTIVFCMAGSAAICWLCDWKMKAIAWTLLFWAVLAVSVAGATLSDRRAMREDTDDE